MNINDLALADEIKEVNVTLQDKVKLIKTFTLVGIQFYRIVEPIHHPQFGSDLSKLGLEDWKILTPEMLRAL